MPLIAITIKLLGAFRKCDVKVIPFRSPYIKEIGSSFASTHLKGEFAIKFPVITTVIHYLRRFSYVNENVPYKSKYLQEISKATLFPK